jgi:UDP-N-acetylglucosamine enolpyruvyl transferase
VHLDSAISHLELASKSPHAASKMTDIQFLTAQLNILKLHHITDNLQAGQSLTKALAAQDGNDIMHVIDNHLHACLKRITSADMNTQDAYIYFFSNLKLSEMKMLQTASHAGIGKDERMELLQFAVMYLENALRSRSLNENVDLHYVSMIQVPQSVG